MAEQYTLMVALKKAFGFKEGQGLKEFADEINGRNEWEGKGLTDKDKEDFKEMFLKERGWVIVAAK
ncbi:MAG: hypothetical protein ACXACD_20895 [Candidatus Thorarchaeota archaeon]|jgi:hypothetical protein